MISATLCREILTDYGEASTKFYTNIFKYVPNFRIRYYLERVINNSYRNFTKYMKNNYVDKLLSHTKWNIPAYLEIGTAWLI